MDSSGEESKNIKNFNFPLINIFNKISLYSKDSSGQLINNNKFIYICGKMFRHISLADKETCKYSFPACNFYIYSPDNNSLYHSNMNSEDCFTDIP